ncbi:MAG: signal peptidase I [Anaerolineales bacterium]|nr:signal peptidase I [Anaerolineales bacterium]
METTQPEVQPQTDPLRQETDDWKRFALDIIETIVLAVILYFGINAISARVRVDGFSMNPTLQNGEYVLVNRLAYKLDIPERGDIIVFTIPTDQKQELIKRVIGLPGETVSVRQNQVLINDVPLEEAYIAQSPLYSGEWIVPEGHLFVLGDNRNGSSDSHQWGVLPMENVIGKALIIYWPPPEWKLINHTEEVFGQPQILDTFR